MVFSEGCPVPRPHHHHAEKWILGSQALIRNLHICTHSNSPAGDTILPKPSLHLRCWSPWPVTSPGGIKEIPGSHCRPGLHPWSPIFRLWEAVWFRGERSRLWRLGPLCPNVPCHPGEVDDPLWASLISGVKREEQELFSEPLWALDPRFPGADKKPPRLYTQQQPQKGLGKP